MKHLLTIISAAVLTAFSMTAQDKDTLKVMTYNLRFGELASMSDFAGFINSEKPDIVALQECDWATYRERAPKQHGVKFVNELAWRTGMFGLYGRSIDYKQGYYGIGILSRYPVVKSERIRRLQRDGGHTTCYGRMHPDRPAYTINTYFNRPNVGCNIHYSQDRLITVREALRLQSFPDSYRIVAKSKQAKNLIVGNAVPPLLAYVLAENLKRYLY